MVYADAWPGVATYIVAVFGVLAFLHIGLRFVRGSKLDYREEHYELRQSKRKLILAVEQPTNADAAERQPDNDVEVQMHWLSAVVWRPDWVNPLSVVVGLVVVGLDGLLWRWHLTNGAVREVTVLTVGIFVICGSLRWYGQRIAIRGSYAYFKPKPLSRETWPVRMSAVSGKPGSIPLYARLLVKYGAVGDDVYVVRLETERRQGAPGRGVSEKRTWNVLLPYSAVQCLQERTSVPGGG